ncbi:FKBP-type peptidyl-prolyl cis-trans isomerase [Sphingobacterium sp. SRCM116780]|uniref:FKBP-type peptidyl-prolyl cis-trans isomerase n=1 Tax=Sphingobacterium sp. SRCM116780 TaxID=2907623 RepID=UPI001F1B0BBC|nr:FKBP-type peptidyl-prolyl cis-trans isomerase [Sphingobacterium sp. SRCM116780]UIR56236.1 FKBP-type peptidyl-prolyl cis-trans isomerase [Sphingobacterium sp. SRCM116780]
MKNFTKILFALLAVIIAFASCNKSDDFDKLAEEQRIKDSINNARIQKLIKDQAPQLKLFATKNFVNPKLDSTTGIWYDLIAEGEEASYTYQFNSNGSLMFPTVVTKYKVNLLNGQDKGALVDESKDDTPATFSVAQVIPAWQIAFFPKKMSYNSKDINIGGLTSKGLKKGSKIKFVAPSPYGYDATVKDKVPANSPLYSEIEVTSIK